MPTTLARFFISGKQHFLDAAGAGGLELLLDSGLQGCVADFDGHGWLLGFKGTGKSGVNQQNPRGVPRSARYGKALSRTAGRPPYHSAFFFASAAAAASSSLFSWSSKTLHLA